MYVRSKNTKRRLKSLTFMKNYECFVLASDLEPNRNIIFRNNQKRTELVNQSAPSNPKRARARVIFESTLLLLLPPPPPHESKPMIYSTIRTQTTLEVYICDLNSPRRARAATPCAGA